MTWSFCGFSKKIFSIILSCGLFLTYGVTLVFVYWFWTQKTPRTPSLVLLLVEPLAGSLEPVCKQWWFRLFLPSPHVFRAQLAGPAEGHGGGGSFLGLPRSIGMPGVAPVTSAPFPSPRPSFPVYSLPSRPCWFPPDPDLLGGICVLLLGFGCCPRTGCRLHPAARSGGGGPAWLWGQRHQEQARPLTRTAS